MSKIYARIIYKTETKDVIYAGIEDVKYNNISDKDLIDLITSNDDDIIIRENYDTNTPGISTLIVSGPNDEINQNIELFTNQVKFTYYNNLLKTKWLDRIKYVADYSDKSARITAFSCIMNEFNNVYNADQIIKPLKKMCEFILNHDDSRGPIYDKIHMIAKTVDDIVHKSDDEINSNALYRSICRIYKESINN